MKTKIEYITAGENEIIIRCKEIDDEVLNLMSLLNLQKRKLIGYQDNDLHMLLPQDIYYIESVDETLYAYTQCHVYRLNSTLSDLELSYRDYGYFRCSKSMVININMILSLKSEIGNRIIATLKNKEQVIISRHYAKSFHEFLSTMIE